MRRHRPIVSLHLSAKGTFTIPNAVVALNRLGRRKTGNLRRRPVVKIRFEDHLAIRPVDDTDVRVGGDVDQAFKAGAAAGSGIATGPSGKDDCLPECIDVGEDLMDQLKAYGLVRDTSFPVGPHGTCGLRVKRADKESERVRGDYEMVSTPGKRAVNGHLFGFSWRGRNCGQH